MKDTIMLNPSLSNTRLFNTILKTDKFIPFQLTFKNEAKKL